MTDLTINSLRTRLGHLDRVWLSFAAILALLALFDPSYWGQAVEFTARSIWHTAPFILFAVLSVAYLKASGAEHLIARAFQGNPVRMIVFAALIGGLAPFCSCEVIPFIAAMLALGAPLAAVMAFWLASPLMDPAMFMITAGTLGFGFAIAKTVAAISIGLAGGLVTLKAANTAVFANPLRAQTPVGQCCHSDHADHHHHAHHDTLWTFWRQSPRIALFRETALSNGLFLLKWLTLAYLIEALMLRYIPADLVAHVLGGAGLGPILLASIVGAPAYLNGYAAVPMVDALLKQGMSNGAAMSFMIAGGISCIPAALAVWALVKPRVFAAYVGLALVGAVLAGIVWQVVA